MFAQFSLAKLFAPLLFVVAVFSFGMFIGHSYTKDHYVEKANKEKLAIAQAYTDMLHASTQKADELSLELEAQKDNIQIEYRTNTKEIIKYVPNPTATQCKDEAGNTIATTLSRDAVGVLNDEKPAAPAVQPTSGSVAEGEALTEVGLFELSTHVEDLKKAYRELAVQHDTLVEYDLHYKSQIQN